MPATLAFFIQGALGLYMATGTAAAIASALITVASYVGVSVGLNMLAQSLFGPSRPKPSDQQITTQIAVGSRYRDYGLVRTGGQETFRDSRDGTLGRIITLATSQESRVIEHLINGNVVTIGSDGTVQGSQFHGAIKIHARHGSRDQSAIGQFTAKFPTWTTRHRQRGCPHVAILAGPVKPDQFSEVYNNQMPDYTQTRWGASVYDPRKDSTSDSFDPSRPAYDALKDETSADYAAFWGDDTGAPRGLHRAGDPASWEHRIDDVDTWEASDNAALVIADFFAHPDGFGGGYDQVNWANIATEADHSDLSAVTASGETVRQWRLWARYALADEERRQVLADMMKAVDGFCWQDVEGKFNLVTGRWEEPDLTLTDDHIITMTMTLGTQAAKTVSGLKPIYTEAQTGYREQEGAIQANPDSDDDPNADAQPLKVYYAPHHNQAERVGHIAVAQLGERWHISAVCNAYGLNTLARRFCRLTDMRVGIDGWFKIDSVKLRLNERPLKVDVTLSEVRPGDWPSRNEASWEGTPPLGSKIVSVPSAVPVPSGLTLTAVQIALSGAYGVAIEAGWDDIGRPDLTVRAQYRPSSGGSWTDMTVDQDARTARSGPVSSGTQYEVWIWAVTLTGRPSDKSAIVTITPVADVALAQPGLQVSGGTGEAIILVMMPSSSNLDRARLYHSTSNDFATATQVGDDITAEPGVTVTITDTGLAAGTEFYWARAFDASGGSSALTGPASATIS